MHQHYPSKERPVNNPKAYTDSPNDQAEYSHSNHNKAKVICLLSLRSRLIIY